jgi:transcriptional regulator of aromatic amino acid metabolism
VQVVSTAPTPLWPAVQDRSFLASLYYRLNTLTFPLVD